MRATLLACALLASAVQLAAPQAIPVPPTVSRILQRMKNPNWAERSAAVDEAEEFMVSGKSAPHDDDQLRLAIIQLLIAENARANVPDDEAVQAQRKANSTSDQDEGDESESEYYAGLIATASAFNDERAIPALVGAMPYASMATGGLLRFGDKALGPVLGELKSRNSLLRASALGMGITLLERRNDAESRTRIRELIRLSLTDPDAVVRSHAVKEIDCRDDRQDFLPTLEKLAKTDPTNWRGRADDGVDGDRFYPVRVAARRVLRDIREGGIFYCR